MNKQEFSDQIAERCELSKAAGARTVEAILETLTETLADRDEVALPGFGKFLAQKRRGREGTDPRNPERTIRIPSTYVAKFRPGSHLRQAVQDSDAGRAQRENPQPPPSRAAAASDAQDQGTNGRGSSTAGSSTAGSSTAKRTAGGWRPLSER
jgi:DNA-binding protein HU-beta